MERKRNNIKDFFLVLKIVIPIMVLATITTTFLAWFGIDSKCHAIFGHSFIVNICCLWATYTNAGKVYFSAKFRALIYFLILISILEFLRTIILFEVYLYYNIILFLPPFAIIIAILTKIRENDKRIENSKKYTNKDY